MASKYLEVKVDDKGTILVDVTPAEGIVPTGGGDIITKAEDAFEKAMSTIQTCAEGFVSHISVFPSHMRPQEVALEFGVTFKSEVGAIVAKTSGDANLKVTLTWKEAKAK
jgi:hypothetical protein